MGGEGERTGVKERQITRSACNCDEHAQSGESTAAVAPVLLSYEYMFRAKVGTADQSGAASGCAWCAEPNLCRSQHLMRFLPPAVPPPPPAAAVSAVTLRPLCLCPVQVTRIVRITVTGNVFFAIRAACELTVAWSLYKHYKRE